MEKNYDFRKRLAVVHRPDMIDKTQTVKPNEISLDSSWIIVLNADADALARRAATDMQDYMLTSMNISLQIAILQKGTAIPPKSLYYTIEHDASNPDTCDIEVTADKVILKASDARGLFRASMSLEDKMNLRRAPFLALGNSKFKSLARLRSVHSGVGIDDFPNEQLNAIAHAGFTCIEIFVKGPNETAKGTVPLNDIIDRAKAYGLDAILYSYMSSYKHPDDADADEFFDKIYGEIFRQHPGFKGIILVGESLDFPSKDPHVSTQPVVDSIPSVLERPGWYPCYDYPAYVTKVYNAVKRVKPDAEVIFNTYNWCYVSAEERKKFLAAIPRDITIQITYEILYQRNRPGLTCPVMDYSISAEEPSYYFTSEVQNAHELGFRHLRTTSNLAGATWDFGTVPYVPVPQRWAGRMKILRSYLDNYDVDSFYDNHHYGWWPNPCNDLAKAIFADGDMADTDLVIKQVAERDYGVDAADDVVSTWATWSDAMNYYVGSNEDQYGPWRSGPAYPFIFQPNISRTMSDKEITFPADPRAHFGSRIIKTFYTPYENNGQPPGPLRIPADIKELEHMLMLWDKGLDTLCNAIPRMPAFKQDNGMFLKALGHFIRNSIVTTINIKKFWLANIKLQACSSRESMLACIDEIKAIAENEIANVKDTFAPVRFDSRLGWEPSMEYVCDEWHLGWKLRQMDSMLREVEAYRKMVLL